jgi:Flp pilus assembly CpaE family ATPase
MSAIAVICAADGRAWESRLLSQLSAAAHGVRIARRCVDVVELLAVAAAGQGQVALVSATLHRLDADAVDRLSAAGVAVVAVLDGDESTRDAATRLQAMGIRHVVGAAAAVEVVVAVLDTALGQRALRGGDESPQHSFALPSAALLPLERGSGRGAGFDSVPARRGAVVAVWGPSGGPGRTTVAMNLADELARLGCEALLVDADVYGGLVAPLLGLLDESPGLAAAARQAAGGTLDPEALTALCWQVETRLRVLTGLPRADRWPELRPAAMPAVLDSCRRLADFTVVDLGFCLETDEELSFDTVAPRRNGATLAVLDEADVIIAVGAGDTAGVHRLVRALSDLRDAQIEAPLWIVLNKVRPGSVRSSPSEELDEALQRYAGQPPAALLPMDLVACDAAMLAGRTLGAAAPRSPLRVAIAELAAALSGRAPAAATRRVRSGRSAARRRASADR